jgi:inner membrane protein
MSEIEPALAWLLAALLLGGAELLVPGVFLVFLAIGAAVTAAIATAVPDVPLVAQIASFGIWSAVAVAIGRRWYRDYLPDTDDALLNDRAARLIGEVVVVEVAIEHGRGRVRIGDGAWVATGADLPVGARARVVGVEGGVVVVEPLAPARDGEVAAGG